jgi:hypothetical protein
VQTQEIEALLAQVDEKIQKAVTNSTYTMAPPTRSIYAPENLDPTIKHVVPMVAPVRDLIPREKGFGQVATWRKLTSRLDPEAGGTGVRLGFADAGQPNQTTQSYTLATASYKNIGRDVEIGRQALASNQGGTLEDMRQHEELVKATEVILGEEDIILNGDSSVTSTEFDGLAKSITTNSGTAGYVTVSGMSTYFINLFTQGADFPTDWVANARQNVALVDSLTASGAINRYLLAPQANADAGLHLARVMNPINGSLVKITSSRYSQGWGYLLTVKSVTGEAWLQMSDLEPMSVYDVPTANHSIVSRVFETTVLKVVAENFQQKVGGLSLT